MTKDHERALVHTAASEREPADRSTTSPRLAYLPPTIEDLGDVRSVVLGASVGTPDTGNPNFGLPQ